jgi:hypothetical protein
MSQQLWSLAPDDLQPLRCLTAQPQTVLTPKNQKPIGDYAFFAGLAFFARLGFAALGFSGFIFLVFSARVSLFLLLMAIALGLTTSFLGQVMVRTPFS